MITLYGRLRQTEISNYLLFSFKLLRFWLIPRGFDRTKKEQMWHVQRLNRNVLCWCRSMLVSHSIPPLLFTVCTCIYELFLFNSCLLIDSDIIAISDLRFKLTSRRNCFCRIGPTNEQGFGLQHKAYPMLSKNGCGTCLTPSFFVVIGGNRSVGSAIVRIIVISAAFLKRCQPTFNCCPPWA